MSHRHFRFRDIRENPQAMGIIFQDFIRNFFKIKRQQRQHEFSVKGERIRWVVDDSLGSGHHLLPVMYTDTSLVDGSRTIIVECKWTPTTLQQGRGLRTLRSDHLYQLHAYISQHAGAQLHAGTVEGLLLYPLVDHPLDVEPNLKGQWIRVRTIDLATSWPEIETQLLELLRPEPFSISPDDKQLRNRDKVTMNSGALAL
jgi:5-methylcytosine-specific restriction enzyme subunit McrC